MADENNAIEQTETSEAGSNEKAGLIAALQAEREKRQALEDNPTVQAALLVEQVGLTPEQILEIASQAHFGNQRATVQQTEQVASVVPEIIGQLQNELTRVSAKLAQIENTTMDEKVQNEIESFASAHPEIERGSAAWKTVGAIAFAQRLNLEKAFEIFKDSTGNAFNKGRETGQKETTTKRSVATEGGGSSRKSEEPPLSADDIWGQVVRKLS